MRRIANDHMHRGADSAGAADIHAISVIGGVDHMACVLGPGQNVNLWNGRIWRFGFSAAQNQRTQTGTQQTQGAKTHQERGGQHADLIISRGDHRRLDPLAREIQIVVRAPFAENVLFCVGRVIGARSAICQVNLGQQPVG